MNNENLKYDEGIERLKTAINESRLLNIEKIEKWKDILENDFRESARELAEKEIDRLNDQADAILAKTYTKLLDGIVEDYRSQGCEYIDIAKVMYSKYMSSLEEGLERIKSAKSDQLVKKITMQNNVYFSVITRYIKGLTVKWSDMEDLSRYKGKFMQDVSKLLEKIDAEKNKRTLVKKKDRTEALKRPNKFKNS